MRRESAEDEGRRGKRSVGEEREIERARERKGNKEPKEEKRLYKT